MTAAHWTAVVAAAVFACLVVVAVHAALSGLDTITIVGGSR